MSALEEIREISKKNNGNRIEIERIEVSKGAIHLLSKYIVNKEFKHPLIVVDENTDQAAGQEVLGLLKDSGIDSDYHILSSNENQQVLANEEILVECLLSMQKNVDALIAVGSGTIHDVVRFVGANRGIPFISVPTAASVDGFASKGAPLIVKGVKKTYQTTAPIAIFADIDILTQAPKEMTAAGFGDILGKYTSLLDWRISALIADEPFVEEAFQMTRKSLEACVENVEKMAAYDDEGLSILMDALIDSGLVMMALDHSRPASGAEHHLSHFWEMDLIRKNKKQILHGAKVGVATGIISDLYKKVAEETTLEDLKQLAEHPYRDKLIKHWDEIKQFIAQLPVRAETEALLKQMGGPATTQELGLEDDLVQESLKEAHHLRDRCTGLFLINELSCQTSKA